MFAAGGQLLKEIQRPGLKVHLKYKVQENVKDLLNLFVVFFIEKELKGNICL